MHSEEEMRVIRPYLERVGLLLRYYERFGEEALTVAADFYNAAGKILGSEVSKSLSMDGNSANEIAAVLNHILMPEAPGRVENIATATDDGRVICKNDAFCPVLEAIKMTGAPLDKICQHFTWPWIEGIASSVNPNIKISVVKSRTWGDDCCLHIIEIQ